MKKIFTFLIISFLSFNSEAQITITGATTYPAANHAYSLSSGYSTTPYPTIGTKDIATLSFSYLDGATSNRYWIVRKANYWHIEVHYAAGAVGLIYKSVAASTDAVPPCNINWQVWNGVWYDYGLVPTYTGSNELLITLTGSCVCPPVLSATVNPTNVHLPLLTTTEYTSFAGAAKGMINYSLNRNAPMVYNGGTWQEVLLNRDTDLEGKLSLNNRLLIRNNGSILFGNNYSTASQSISVNATDIILNNAGNGLLTLKSNGQFFVRGYQANQNSILSIGGSVDYPIKYPTAPLQTSASMGQDDHTFVNTGTNLFSLILPDPTTSRGRHYFIINHGTMNVTTTFPIKTGYSTSTNIIIPNNSAHIFSDGTDWRLVN